MYRKFACIEYVKSPEEVPLKFNILKKSPSIIMDWYIRKFNPFTIEEIEVVGEKGFLVKLPVTERQADLDRELLESLMTRTVFSLKDYNVDIIMPPKYAEPPEIIRTAFGTEIFTFFIMEAILKALKIMKKDIKYAEVLIIDGDKSLTMNLLDRIYPHVNYLNIITSEENLELYEIQAKNIFSETGLNLFVSADNKGIIKDADIILNTSAEAFGYDFSYKRGAIYFELCKNVQKPAELAIKRGDMLIIDDIRIQAADTYMNIRLFEMVIFMRSKEYRAMLGRGYDSHIGGCVERHITDMGAGLSALLFCGKIISSSHLQQILYKAGV